MKKFVYEYRGVRIEQKIGSNCNIYNLIFTPSFNGDRTIPLSEKDFLKLTEKEDIKGLSKILGGIDSTLTRELKPKELITINSALLGAREIYDENTRRKKEFGGYVDVVALCKGNK